MTAVTCWGWVIRLRWPALTRVIWAWARSAMNCWAVGVMMASWVPRTYHDGIVAQAGGTLDSVFVAVLQGFAATITEAQAVNLAAHPDILDVEQNLRVCLDD